MTQGGDEGQQQPGQPGQYQGFPPPPPAPPYADPYGQQHSGQQQVYGEPSYGQQPYGQPSPYPQQSYGQAPWSPPGFGPPAVRYASWGQRAAALIIDGLLGLLLFLPGIIVVGIGAVQADDGNEGVGVPLVIAGSVLLLAALAVQVWNQGWRQGVQGWSWGKQVMKIKLVRTADARPPGGGVGIGRLALRAALGNVTFGVYSLLTYLWPLWDERNQSLDDKILNTLVVRAD